MSPGLVILLETMNWMERWVVQASLTEKLCCASLPCPSNDGEMYHCQGNGDPGSVAQLAKISSFLSRKTAAEA